MNARSMKKDRNIVDLNDFSRRLKSAADALGLPIQRIATLIEKNGSVSGRTAYSHLRGDRVPAYGKVFEYAALYASVLSVDENWLLYGRTASDINHVDRSPHGDSSQLTPFRSITLRDRHGVTHVPFPSGLSVNAEAFIWRIPSGDYSMVGDERRLFPGTFLVIDPVGVADVAPGHVVLCRPKGFAEFIVRAVKAIGPLDIAKKFELVSVNPLFDPIKIQNIAACEMAGRALFSINQL